jgi:DNA adenine methylase
LSANSTRPTVLTRLPAQETPSRRPAVSARARPRADDPLHQERLRRLREAPALPRVVPPPRDTPRPIVKWVGGKTQLLPTLFELLPRTFKAYHETFVGGGAFFFGLTRADELRGHAVYLSDVNKELVSTYSAVRDDVSGVVRALERHQHDRDHYYALRAEDPWSLSATQRAARLLYLNRTGFNGLYRVNRKGEFNVPFGKYENPTICDHANLLAVSKALRQASVEHRSFETVLDRAERGDLVYFDPPYVPVSPTANFVGYAQGGFGEAEQERLAEVFETLARRGVSVMLSNSDTPWVRRRYGAHRVVAVSARRNVNSRASDRGPIGEVVVVAGPR